jgi:hypothetical protein
MEPGRIERKRVLEGTSNSAKFVGSVQPTFPSAPWHAAASRKESIEQILVRLTKGRRHGTLTGHECADARQMMSTSKPRQSDPKIEAYIKRGDRICRLTQEGVVPLAMPLKLIKCAEGLDDRPQDPVNPPRERNVQQ